MAIYNNKILIGAYSNDDNGGGSGSAYIFDADTGSELLKLLPDDGNSGDVFGYRVDIGDNRAIGSAYLFDTNTGNQIAKLLTNDGANSDLFGFSVSINGDKAIVGAYGDDDNGSSSGSAYVFGANTGTQLFKLLPSNGNLGDRFGQAVANYQNKYVIGALHWDSSINSSNSAG